MLCLILLLILPLTLPVPARAEDGFDLSVPGLRIGVESGSVQAQLVEKLYPKAQLFYFSKMDGYNAVAQGKIDCFVFDKKQMEIAVRSGIPGVRVLEQTVGEDTEIAFGLSPRLRDPEPRQGGQRLYRRQAEGRHPGRDVRTLGRTGGEGAA